MKHGSEQPQGLIQRILAWASRHTAAATASLALLCFVGIALVFYFVVFSDFGGSADFIYNQF